MLETNIDDMNPEIYSYIMDKLFDKGALDVYYTPIYMKKNRPATKVSVLCTECLKNSLKNILFYETSTLGIRELSIHREALHREYRKVMTTYGECQIKCAIKEGKIIKYSPEYEDCKKLAKQNNVPIHNVYEEAMSQAIKFSDQG